MPFAWFSLALLNCDTLFDITPPKIKIVSPKADSTYFGTLPIELDVTDNGKVKKVEVFLDGESIYEFSKGPYKTDLDLDQINASSISLKAVAHDRAGNYAEASREVSLSLGLKLTSPNGGETWAEQSNQTITWESSGNVGSTVSLHSSTDGGNTWDEISGSTANNGTFTWTLSNFIETQSACKIKVSTSQYNDVSDSAFTISAEPNTLTLTSPNGGETWQEQSTQTITWTSSGDVGDYVGLDYSLNRDATWIEIVASTANDGSYSWTLPNLNETHTSCSVMVSSNSTSHFSQSDASFTISAEPNYITVTSPNGGEIWAEQSTQTVTWTYGGDVGNSVSLAYSVDGGTNWIEISTSTTNDGSYSWTLPNLLESTTTCRIKVASTTTSFTDTSDTDFTIYANYLTITSPNGGETWTEQSTHDITWDYSGDVGDNVSLHYSLDGGTTWTQIVASTANDGSQAWTLPDLTVSEQACKIKVASTSTSYFDESDGSFTITGGDLTLTAPNGGENWREWSTQTITWTASGEVGGYVGLHYSLDGGTTWTEITTSTLNDGSYSWTLPTISATQTACRVKVSSTTTGHYHASDGNFTMENWVPILAGTYDTPGEAFGVFVSGSYAYVADMYGGLQVIDFTNPASPTLAGSYDTPDRAVSVFVSGGYAYVAESESGLQAIDVSNPASPTLTGSYDTPDYARGVFVSGSYAYVANSRLGLPIINISNPASPTLAGTYNTPGYAEGVFVSGGYAYVADYSSGLQVINVFNPANPTLASTYNTPDHAKDVFVSGGYAYVADYRSGLQIINVSNPASPSLAGSYNTPGYAGGVFVSGSYAYVADATSGLQIIDVSDPASPTLVGSYSTPSSARGVFVSGGYAYVAEYESGLQILDISGLP